MPKRIQEDHKDFRDVVSGRTRRELKRLIKNGGIVRNRGKGGKIQISIPSIDIPHFLFGDNGEQLGRGKGKKGQVIDRKNKGKGNGPGEQHADGITISLDLDDVLRFMQDELGLPDMKPKPSETYEEIKTVYTDISKIGPESLRHTRRTLLETLKRLAMTKDLNNMVYIPGHTMPVRMLTPINNDRRYRQYREIKIPSSNAVIFFMRDCSGSMDDYRCDIVSDMAWWIDKWIRKFYERVERCYIIHDTEAEVVDEEKFYKYRMGGGTKVSSAFKEVEHQLENKYPPHQYNVYVFYFTDGDNWGDDNEELLKTIKEKLNQDVVNLIGVTQIMSYGYEDSVHSVLSDSMKKGEFNGDFLKLARIGDEENSNMSEEERGEQIMKAIKELIGKEKKVTA